MWLPEKADRARAASSSYDNRMIPQLSGYYCDCLIHDGGINMSLSLEPTVPPSHFSLSAITGAEAKAALAKVPVKPKIGEIRAVGYPCFTRVDKVTGEWKLEPLLVWLEANGDVVPGPVVNTDLIADLEVVAPIAKKASARVFVSTVLGDDTLEFSTTELCKVIERLQNNYPNWSGVCALNPLKISAQAKPIGEKAKRFHNTAIAFRTFPSQYVKGTVGELNRIRSNPPHTKSVLDNMVDGKPAGVVDDKRLPFELDPLNPEQRKAVRLAMSANPIIVVEGPPGTGKSQVVAAIVYNAIMRRQSVLVTARTHQAIKVVVDRINDKSKPIKGEPVILPIPRPSFGITDNDTRKVVMDCMGMITNRPLAAGDFPDKDFDKAVDQHQQIQRELDTIYHRINESKQWPSIKKQIDEAIGIQEHIASRFLDHDAIQVAIDEYDAAIAPPPTGFLRRLFWWLGSGKREGQRLRAIQAFFQAIGSGEIDPELVVNLPIDYWRQRLPWGRRAVELYRKQCEIKQLESPDTVIDRLIKSENIIRDKNVNDHWRHCFVRPRHQQVDVIQDFIGLLNMWIKDGNVKKKVFAALMNQMAAAMKIKSAWYTTSQTAKHIPHQFMFDLVIIDEAGQVDAASMIPLLARAKRAVFVGDENQLSHITQLSSNADFNLLAKHKIPAKWNYSTQSALDHAKRVASNTTVTLVEQYRSHPVIIEFSLQKFYGKQGYAVHPRPGHRYDAIQWIDVQGNATKPFAGSVINRCEAEAVVSCLQDMHVSSMANTSIGVVTPFRPQANLIQSLIQKRLSGQYGQIHVDTSHGFQGDQRDIILFSPVAASGFPKTCVDFLNRERNAINVALTRARDRLIVVGDKSYVLKSEVKTLVQLAEYIENIELSQHITPATQRNRATKYEQKLYQELDKVIRSRCDKVMTDKGYSIHWQYRAEGLPYCLDIAIVEHGNDAGRRLNIELDGDQHRNPDQIAEDQIRMRRLRAFGWDIKRFWNWQVENEIDQCVEEVRNWFWL